MCAQNFKLHSDGSRSWHLLLLCCANGCHLLASDASFSCYTATALRGKRRMTRGQLSALALATVSFAPFSRLRDVGE
jgi:hypothetical protein